MDFEYKEVVEHPIEKVYAVLRDHLELVVPFLPSVEQIECVERVEVEPGIVQVVNHWQANAGSAPPATRPFLSKKMTQWKDYATWKDEAQLVEWRFETLYLDRLYDCTGTNLFEDLDGERTEVRLTGSLVVYSERVPGVPKFLMRRLAPKIEAYLIDTVTPNLAQLPQAVQTYLDENS